jgi:hypothetical protein
MSAGLHYNYYRDYDPATGRYLQSDPIGLAGGVNPYAYVGNNPLRYVDPFGLMKIEGWEHAVYDSSVNSQPPSIPCDGRWRRISWSRDLLSAFTLDCTCWWSCLSCPPMGDAYPLPNSGQTKSKGKIIFSAKPGKDFDPESGDECVCGPPGPAKGCGECPK